MFNNLISHEIFGDHFISPIYGISKKIQVSIEGLHPILLVHDDVDLNNYIDILRVSAEQIYKIYKELYVFHQPQLSFQPHSGIICASFHMYERERWEKFEKEKHEQA